MSTTAKHYWINNDEKLKSPRFSFYKPYSSLHPYLVFSPSDWLKSFHRFLELNHSSYKWKEIILFIYSLSWNSDESTVLCSLREKYIFNNIETDSFSTEMNRFNGSCEWAVLSRQHQSIKNSNIQSNARLFNHSIFQTNNCCFFFTFSLVNVGLFIRQHLDTWMAQFVWFLFSQSVFLLLIWKTINFTKRKFPKKDDYFHKCIFDSFKFQELHGILSHLLLYIVNWLNSF